MILTYVDITIHIYNIMKFVCGVLVFNNCSNLPCSVLSDICSIKFSRFCSLSGDLSSGQMASLLVYLLTLKR